MVHSRLSDEKGIVLAVVLFGVALMVTFLSAGLWNSGLNLKAVGNYKTSTAVLQAADAGIAHALRVIPTGLSFSYTKETTIVDSIPLGNGYTYTVKVVNDPASVGGNSRAILTSTATGPNGAKRTLKAYLVRGDYGLGATNLLESAAEKSSIEFSGNSFIIDGNDRCGAAPSIPGIMVSDSALAKKIRNDTTYDGGLNADQMDNVTGLGVHPSVYTAAPPDKKVHQYVTEYLLLPNTTLKGGTYGRNDRWGSQGKPRITHIAGDARITGNVKGYGVLILGGSLETTGKFEFNGLVIMRGKGVLQATGDAKVNGVLMIGANPDGNTEIEVSGNVEVRYDSCAIATANGWALLPKLSRLFAWQDELI